MAGSKSMYIFVTMRPLNPESPLYDLQVYVRWP
jgi:hypothetical protein